VDILPVLEENQMSPQAKEHLAGVKKKIGKVPNGYAVTAHSPIALDAFLSSRKKLRQGQFNAQETEAIALVTAQELKCSYCLAGHTLVAKMARIPEDETLRLRKGESENPKFAALAALAQDIVRTQGRPSDDRIQVFFNAGYSREALVELIAHIAINYFTAYLNKVARTPSEYPPAKEI